MSDNDRKTPPAEDPWARWRTPEANVAVDAEKPAKTETAAEATEAPRPTGTLGVRKKAVENDKPARDPRRQTDSKPYGKAKSAPGARPFVKRTTEADGDKTDNPWGKRSEPRRNAPPSDRHWGDTPKPYACTNERTPVAEQAPAPRHATTTSPADAPQGIRLSKVMSERGMCSRREADLWIERGWVYVDGEQVSELGSRIDPSAAITVSKEAERDQAKQVTILLHKPVGYVSGQPEPGCTPAVTLISEETQVAQSGDPEFKPWMLRGLAPAGRLDVDSTGFLVLTSDGRVAKKLIGEDSQAEKEYLVRVSGRMIDGGLDLLRHGLELDGKPLRPAWVKQLNEDQLHIILKEGKKRQIRRMCELVGLKVTGLKRVRIGRIRLGDLPMGKWRFLREGEAF